MYRDVLWFGNHVPVSLLGNREVMQALGACPAPVGRCFFVESGSRWRHGIGDFVDDAAEQKGVGASVKGFEQRIWWHSVVHLLELPKGAWNACQKQVVLAVSEPAFWNGQDTNNIFHVLVSFIGRLWVHLHSHAFSVLTTLSSRELTSDFGASLLYIFDVHPKRPHMLNSDGSPSVPGRWAEEFARHAFPRVRLTHADDLASQAPVIFRRLHFNLVNWASWILPSEDLHPPRISRKGVGPHPVLTLLPAAVKASIRVDESEGRGNVLLVRRAPPAGRRLTNEVAFGAAMRELGLSVQLSDFSLMVFAAQVEAVAHARVLVGAHGQGLFNLVFLPSNGAVVEVPPCGVPLALVHNVAELFGFAFAEILDTSCDQAFVDNFTALGCSPCVAREIKTAGGPEDLDSEHVGDCERIAPECDVRSAQTLTINDVSAAAIVVRDVFQAAARGASARA